MRRPTLRDVARTCRVSPSTVSKALSPHADRCDISPATRERVQAAARELGFLPSVSHAQRTRRLWRNIGLLWGRFAPFTNGVYEGALDVIGERLHGRGWSLLYTPVPTPEAWQAMQMAQRLDGVLAVSNVHDGILAELVRSRYPAVLLNLRTDHPLPQFLPDESGAMTALVGHLAGLGHRRLVYMTHRSDGVGHFSEGERRSALVRLARTQRMRVDAVPGGAIERAVEACRAGATAVVCYDWNDAHTLSPALVAAGLPVPARVSVTSCCDVSWFTRLSPPLTAIGIPMRTLAAQAIDHLLERISGGGGPPRTVVLPGELRIRASTGPAPR